MSSSILKLQTGRNGCFAAGTFSGLFVAGLLLAQPCLAQESGDALLVPQNHEFSPKLAPRRPLRVSSFGHYRNQAEAPVAHNARVRASDRYKAAKPSKRYSASSASGGYKVSGASADYKASPRSAGYVASPPSVPYKSYQLNPGQNSGYKVEPRASGAPPAGAVYRTPSSGIDTPPAADKSSSRSSKYLSSPSTSGYRERCGAQPLPKK